tara:strand:- start:64691 stop:65410 length:720 start_codon:yes stop_codon:yes gene_type:complete
MQDFIHYLLSGSIYIFSIEFLAALAGIYYLKNTKATKWDYYFVVYLWITIIVEITGLYSTIGYYSDYKYFSFVEYTGFRANFWLFNIYAIFAFSFLSLYYRSLLSSKTSQKILKFLTGLYIVVSLLMLFSSDVFFNGFSKFSFFSGVLILLLSVFMYYYELLLTDKILNLKYNLSFYFSVGLIIFYVCLTPLTFLSDYLASENGLFLKLFENFKLYGNLFLYSTFILAFLICSKKNKSS